MRAEALRKELPTTKEPHGDLPIVIDEEFWGNILSLYRLRLHHNFGLTTFNTLASIGEVIKELDLPHAEESVDILHSLSVREEAVFGLMQQHPWNINPLTPATDKETGFMESMGKLTEGDFHKRRNLVVDFFQKKPISPTER